MAIVRIKQRIDKFFFAFILFAPSLIILSVVVAYPMIKAFILSMYDYNLLSPTDVKFVFLKNFFIIFL